MDFPIWVGYQWHAGRLKHKVFFRLTDAQAWVSEKPEHLEGAMRYFEEKQFSTMLEYLLDNNKG